MAAISMGVAFVAVNSEHGDSCSNAGKSSRFKVYLIIPN